MSSRRPKVAISNLSTTCVIRLVPNYVLSPLLIYVIPYNKKICLFFEQINQDKSDSSYLDYGILNLQFNHTLEHKHILDIIHHKHNTNIIIIKNL